MKKEYRDSIRATLSEDEWEQLVKQVQLPNVKITKHFVTHIGLERPSKSKRTNHVKFTIPFYKRLFKKFY